MKMDNIMFGSTKINYDLIKKGSSDYVTLVMDPKQGLIVKAPEEVSDDRIKNLLHKKAKWILEKQSLINELVKLPLNKEFMSGESISYLGRTYLLKIKKDESNNTKLYRGKLIVNVQNKNDSKLIKEQIIDWYNTQARKKIKERIKIYSKKLGVEPSRINIKEFNKRWASCTKGGILNFDWRLILAPMSILDYIVVHELCHLKINKHSKYFWQKIASILPDFENRKEWLRINGPSLNLL